MRSASGKLVSGDFFSVLGTKASVGRLFAPEEYGDKPGAFPLVVISDRFWRSHFNADPPIARKTIRVNQHEHGDWVAIPPFTVRSRAKRSTCGCPT